MEKDGGGPPQSLPTPRGVAGGDGVLGVRGGLAGIYRSTRLFGPFSTRPESASPPGSSECWRGLPTADTHIFRAHHHLSFHQPPSQMPVSGCKWSLPAPFLLLSSPALPSVSLSSKTPPAPTPQPCSSTLKSQLPEDATSKAPSQGLPRPLALEHAAPSLLLHRLVQGCRPSPPGPSLSNRPPVDQVQPPGSVVEGPWAMGTGPPLLNP